MSTNIDNSETSLQNISHNQVEPSLPRSAWSSQLAYFKVMFRAKKALDRIEKEAGIENNYS